MKIITAVLAAMLLCSNAEAAFKNIWITQCELGALPTSTSAWSACSTTAVGSWGTADMANQDNMHPAKLLAGSLVFARKAIAGTVDTTLRGRVRDGIIAAKRSLDQSTEYAAARPLAVGRQMAAYCIAADLIDLSVHAPTVDAEFTGWLATIDTTTLSNQNVSNGRSIVQTHEGLSHNWGTFCGAARIAIARYLGDTTDLTRAWAFFQSYTDRSKYPTDAWFYPTYGDENYFQRHPSFWFTSWVCDDLTTKGSQWTATNHGGTCTSLGNAIGGSNVMDVARNSSSSADSLWPVNQEGVNYSWDSMAAQFMQAEMLLHSGYDPYVDGSSGLKRGMDFLYTQSPSQYSAHRLVPWIANHRYAAGYTTQTLSGASLLWGMWWTDWTHPAPSTAAASPFTAYVTYPWVGITFPRPVGAQEYDVRYSLSPITTATHFSAAQAATGEPAPCPATENFYLIDEIGVNTVYYFAMKYKNSAGAWSSMATDTTVMPSGAGGGGCGECLEEARPSRDEPASEIRQTSFTIQQAREVKGVVWFDVLGRRVQNLRAGFYVIQEGASRRRVVVR